jgi:hypothetical protein
MIQYIDQSTPLHPAVLFSVDDDVRTVGAIAFTATAGQLDFGIQTVVFHELFDELQVLFIASGEA